MQEPVLIIRALRYIINISWLFFPIFIAIESSGLNREVSAQTIPTLDPRCNAPEGIIIDSMESVGDWSPATLISVAGYKGQAVQLNYDLGHTTGAYVQLRRDFNPPLDLSSGDHLRFFYKGTAPNSLEVGLVSVDGHNYFNTYWKSATHVPGWTYATWDFQNFQKDNQPFPDFSQVKAIFISVVIKEPDVDLGGQGSFAVDELQYLKIASRNVPSDFDSLTPAPTIAQNAAEWIASRQQNNGFLESWSEEEVDLAHLYDQALGLIVLSGTDLARAHQLAAKLHELQNTDGSWYVSYHYLTNEPTGTKPTDQAVGAIAWAVYALTRYVSNSGDSIAYQDALEGAAWLADLQRRRSDGSLPGTADPSDSGAPTEPNLDAWWAFQATGFQTQADLLRDFLLNEVWDNTMGRFKAGPSGPESYQIFLDNQTWGAAFLHAVGHEEDARRALSYAQWNLVTSASNDNNLCGFDGAGPFSVWNEGTLQYIIQGGENSQYYWDQMVKQQGDDGGLPGSPDNLSAYIVWLTPWHGIAPTAWFYFAGTGGPFVTDVFQGDEPFIPLTFELYQNYPNPFNPNTLIQYDLPKSTSVRLEIYNTLGQRIRTLINRTQSSGHYLISWDGLDDLGRPAASGVYLYCIIAGNSSLTRKALLLR